MKKFMCFAILCTILCIQCKKSDENVKESQTITKSNDDILNMMNRANAEYKKAAMSDTTNDQKKIANDAYSSFIKDDELSIDFQTVVQDEKFKKMEKIVDQTLGMKSLKGSSIPSEIDSLVNMIEISELGKVYQLKMKNIFLDEKYLDLISSENDSLSKELQTRLVQTALSDVDSINYIANQDSSLSLTDKNSVYITSCVMKTYISNSLLNDIIVVNTSKFQVKGWFNRFIRSVVKVFIQSVVTNCGILVCTGSGPLYGPCVAAWYMGGNLLAEYADKKYMAPTYPAPSYPFIPY